MSSFPIRPLTRQELHDLAEERAAERYRDIYDETLAAERAEYEAEFDEEFRKKHPYKERPSHIHFKTMERLKKRINRLLFVIAFYSIVIVAKQT